MSLSFQYERASELTVDDPKKRRPKRIRTLDTWELETKAELTAAEQVTEMVDRVRRLSNGVSKASTRQQFHTVFAKDDKGYHGVVLVNGSEYVGVRSKNTGELIETPGVPFPLYLRNETSFKPKDTPYIGHLREVFQAGRIGSFDKRCADLAFWVGDTSFTATVSIVDRPDERADGCYQLELEYDGHREHTAVPSMDRILANFHEAYDIALGKAAPSTRTKLEWVAILNDHPDVIPAYRPVPATQSTLPRLIKEAR